MPKIQRNEPWHEHLRAYGTTEQESALRTLMISCSPWDEVRTMVIYDMTPDDCRKMLQRENFGRLACANGNQPYVVPIYFAHQGEYLYGFSALGQKIAWMRANPSVCVQMDAVTSGDQWLSVIVTGRYEELPDIAEWREEVLDAYESIRKRALWWQPSYASAVLRDSSQPPTPVHYRIHVDQVTGRRAFPSPADATAAGYGTSA